MEITASKDSRGNWHTETEVDVGMPGKVLMVTTMKRSSGRTITTAQVNILERGMRVYMPFSDFGVQLSSSEARCTEKLVRAQHAAALVEVRQPSFAVGIRNHYAQALA